MSAGTITIRWSGSERTFEANEVITIGRDPACTVVVTAASASRRHAELRVAGASWVLTDLGSSRGTHVEGAAVTSRPIERATTAIIGSLEAGDHLELVPHGDAAATDLPTDLASTGAGVVPTEAADGMRPGGQLRADEVAGATVVTGAGLAVSCAGTTVDLQPGQQAIVGRDADCDLVSTNPTVSRRHLSITQEAGGWIARDLSSSGGTYLDGRRTSAVSLQGSTSLMLGDPDAGERVVIVGAGTRALNPIQRLERAARGRSAVLVAVVAVVAVLAVVVGVLAITTGGGDSAPDNTQLARATVLIDVGSASGSGTIVDAERGLILTNAHVVKPQAAGQAILTGVAASDLDPDPSAIVVAVADGLDKPAEPRFKAKVVAVDGYADLAVIKLSSTFTGASLSDDDLKDLVDVDLGDSDKAKTGDAIRVVGFPGIASSSAATLTAGVIAGTQGDARIGSDRARFNIDAKIGHGNSGGLAVDRDGRLIGIPEGGFVDGDDSIDFMLPVNLAKPLIAAAQKGESYKSPYVTALTGDEELDDFALATSTIDEGFAECGDPAESDAEAGDDEITLSFTYKGFRAGQHQDALIALLDEDSEIIGSVATADQFPYEWKASGTTCVTIPLDPALEVGDYDIVVLLGPNYEHQASDGLVLTVSDS
jgi:pSer/pThr/pTyr-binding forkhead associated (FHA) protein